MPYCPNCNIQVTGNTCTNCGRPLVAQPPSQQGAPGQTAQPMPPPPSQPPQYQQPVPSQTAPAQTTTMPQQTGPQQAQAQPPYTPYTQPPAQAPPIPPRKSKKGPIIAVLVVVAILVLATLAYVLFSDADEDGENGDVATITYDQLMDDVEIDTSSMSMTFKSYDDGDELNVIGTVESIRTADVPSGIFGVDSGKWTIITFESQGADIWNQFAYKGDLRSDYTIGQNATIKIGISGISISGLTAEYPDEAMTASMITEYIEIPNITLEFTETSPGNYTGGITSDSDIMPLKDLGIEIYDSSSSSHGYDDGDLTDEDPEEIEAWSGNLALEFRDINNNKLLDSQDTITLTHAGPGDKITIEDDELWETITEYTIS